MLRERVCTVPQKSSSRLHALRGDGLPDALCRLQGQTQSVPEYEKLDFSLGSDSNFELKSDSMLKQWISKFLARFGRLNLLPLVVQSEIFHDCGNIMGEGGRES